ncbi:ABC transporter substrate-binding protein [Paenibacillus sp. CAA11]|uniref:ABC transporter substrate-binding protein n=1 Tax=Paenibacillus sp. CAA11 TaxID=1532905 RepID=UPI000D3C220C|nr:extracellular solute-binding protein [Paenibacillus sp. CAA11]AWB43313.1 ABC transporter substrate-binding protein [Paenibacillus sp. CAA11]
MRKRTGRLMALAMAVLLTASVLTGCGGANNTPISADGESTGASGKTTDNGLDISKKVTLQFYMLGDAPKDLPVIEEEINKLAERDLNAKVKFNYTSWTDWDQKYKLLLSSGQPVDLIFTADWTGFQSYAKKGAFQPLDELLPKASPKLYEYVPKDMWEAVKVDGKTYTVPATYKEYVTNGFVYREDLRKKYNLPVPKDIPSYEAYMDGIKANEPDMMALATTSDPSRNLMDQFREISHNPIGGPLPYGIGIKYDQPGEVYSYWGSEEQIEDLKTVKRWAEKGFFPKNVLNQKDTMQDQLTSGKAASILGDNPTRFNDAVIKLATTHPDWELGYYPYPLTRGFASPVHPIHNGFAVPKSSKNPERALAFYEKLVTDKEYNWLTEYGIEGKNFEVDQDGYYKMLGDKNSNGFAREGMNGWAWRNPEYMLFDKTFDRVKEIFAELDKIQKPDIFTGFAEDYTAYQSERAALEQVEKQYLYPLEAGLIENVEEGVRNFMEKAKQAGLEKAQAGFKEQWLKYVQEKGVN